MAKGSLALAFGLLILVSCGSPGRPAVEQVVEAPDAGSAVTTSEWAGSYADTLPCADCPGILTELELRPDSLYILRERYLERDSVPYGQLGIWHVAQGQLLLVGAGGTPERWRAVAGGLERLGMDGKPVESSLSFVIHRTAHHTSGPMHLNGTYADADDARSFTPCGMRFPIPVAVNGPADALAVLDPLSKARKQDKGAALNVQVVALLQQGPAREGAGSEDYIRLVRMEQVLDGGCP